MNGSGLTRRRPAGARIVAGLAALLTTVGLAACTGSTQKQAHIVTSFGPAVRSPSSTSASASHSPSPSPSPTAIPDQVGDIVATNDAIDAACGQGVGRVDPTASAGAGQTTGSGKVVALLPGGRAILACDNPSSLLELDLVHGTIGWAHPLVTTQASASGAGTQDVLLDADPKNVYILTLTKTAPSGLQDAVVTRKVSAFDSLTGQQRWSQPLEPNDQTTYNDRGSADESAGPSGAGTEVLVHVDDFSAFDAITGVPLWRLPKLANGTTYIGFNEQLGVSGSGSTESLSATSVTTGLVVWSDPVTPHESALADSGTPTTEVVGNTYWVFSPAGYDAYNLLTGASVGHARYPTEWKNTVATTTHVVTEVDGTLRLFPLDDWSRPIWSVSASDQTSIDALTADSVLVQVPAGLTLLSATDGSILQQGLDSGLTVRSTDIVDGLAVTNEGVFELGVPK